jgi:hypothetical protein
LRIVPPDQEVLRLTHQMLAESSQIVNFLPLGRDKCLRISPRQHQRIAVQQTVKQVERIRA